MRRGLRPKLHPQPRLRVSVRLLLCLGYSPSPRRFSLVTEGSESMNSTSYEEGNKKKLVNV